MVNSGALSVGEWWGPNVVVDREGPKSWWIVGLGARSVGGR